MTEDLLVVRTEALRSRARELTDSAYQLGHGLAGVPGLLVTAPGWAAAEALTELESAGHAWLGGLGARVAELGAGLRHAAETYDAADDRAARRLVQVR